MIDDDLDEIADQNSRFYNTGTRSHVGAKRGGAKKLFSGKGAKLARLFSRAKSVQTRKKNKASLLSSTERQENP